MSRKTMIPKSSDEALQGIKNEKFNETSEERFKFWIEIVPGSNHILRHVTPLARPLSKFIAKQNYPSKIHD